MAVSIHSTLYVGGGEGGEGGSWRIVCHPHPQDAEAILEGQTLGRTRSQTKGVSPTKTTPSPKKPAKKTAMKKEGTMVATAKVC